MRKTLLLFTTMALALLLAAGTAWAALPAPTVLSTVPPNGTSGVDPAANITAQFSEAMSTKSLQILNHSTTTPPSTDSSNTFYLLKGHFIGVPPVSFTDTLSPSPAPSTTYTVVVEGAGDGDKVSVKDTGGTPMKWPFRR